MSDTSGIEAVDSAGIGADDTGNPVVEDNAPVGESQQESQGHPAWKEILDVLPSSLHPIVTPALSKWDQGVQERFQQVQSKYEPYNSLVENGIQPDRIEQALGLARMMEEDPQGLYARMGEYFSMGKSNDQGQTTENEDDEFDIGSESSPEWERAKAELEQNQQLLAQGLQAMMQEKANAEAEAKLEADLKALKEKHGEFDEEFVLTYALNNGNNLEAGVKKYNELAGRLRGTPTPGSNIPTPLAPGGATPSNSVDPTTLSNQDTKSLVVNLLQQLGNAQKE